MGAKAEIIKRIETMNGKYSAYSIFRDWTECCALSIQNSCVLFHDEVWKKREEQYLNIIKKYDEKERNQFTEMFGLLSFALEENVEDVLGDVYMKSGCYSKQLGQFFTPFHLAELTAELSVTDDMDENEIIYINEPSVGGGANIIGFAKALKEKNINYQDCLRVVAQDLDWLAVYMSYVQFSLLGINGEIAQGDTLREPYSTNNIPPERVFKTPKRMGVLI